MFQIKLTQTAAQAFTSLHPEVKKQLKEALMILKESPYTGKLLREELISFRSLKIKRYRIIYQVDDSESNIVVVALGHRRDIYEITTKLLQDKEN